MPPHEGHICIASGESTAPHRPPAVVVYPRL